VEAVRPWILGALAYSLGLGVIGKGGLLIRGNYWSLTTKISIDLDDTTGNLSDEARELALDRANEAIRGELGIDPINFAHSTNVALLLDDEEIWLEGLGEFPPVHVSVIEGEGE